MDGSTTWVSLLSPVKIANWREQWLQLENIYIYAYSFDESVIAKDKESEELAHQYTEEENTSEKLGYCRVSSVQSIIRSYGTRLYIADKTNPCFMCGRYVWYDQLYIIANAICCFAFVCWLFFLFFYMQYASLAQFLFLPDTRTVPSRLKITYIDLFRLM